MMDPINTSLKFCSVICLVDLLYHYNDHGQMAILLQDHPHYLEFSGWYPWDPQERRTVDRRLKLWRLSCFPVALFLFAKAIL